MRQSSADTASLLSQTAEMKVEMNSLLLALRCANTGILSSVST